MADPSLDIYSHLFSFCFQLTQLLICDWLLETRTALWEDSTEADSTVTSVSNYVLSSFQRDLSSLRTLTQHVPVSLMLKTINNAKIFSN